MDVQRSRGAISGAGRSRGSGETGVLFDIKRFALHDGPGIRTTVFFKGCPLSCAWCHNPESQRPGPELMFWEERCVGCGACVSSCPVEAISIAGGIARTDRERCTGCGACVSSCPVDARSIAGEAWSLERVLSEIEKDVLFYDESGGGVTLSGGEPLAQASFAVSLLEACRRRRIHTVVDTCGYGDGDELEAMAATTDLLLYDLKQMDDRRHREWTGVSNRPILDNLKRLDRGGHRLWIRVPLIPNVNDGEENLRALGALIAELTSVEAVYLLPFHRGGERKRERLGRAAQRTARTEDARTSAERARSILCGIVNVPVRIGG